MPEQTTLSSCVHSVESGTRAFLPFSPSCLLPPCTLYSIDKWSLWSDKFDHIKPGQGIQTIMLELEENPQPYLSLNILWGTFQTTSWTSVLQFLSFSEDVLTPASTVPLSYGSDPEVISGKRYFHEIIPRYPPQISSFCPSHNPPLLAIFLYSPVSFFIFDFFFFASFLPEVNFYYCDSKNLVWHLVDYNRKAMSFSLFLFFF